MDEKTMQQSVPSFLEKAGAGLDLPEAGGAFIPRIKLLQKTSFELEATSDKFIESAVGKDGSFAIYLDNEVKIVDKVNVMPIAFVSYCTEYIPMESGGGFVANYKNKTQAKKLGNPKNDFVDTIDCVCQITNLPNNIFILPFTSTKIAVYNELYRVIKKAGRLDGLVFTMGSEVKKNKAGQTWYIYKMLGYDWINKTYSSAPEKRYKQYSLMAKSQEVQNYVELFAYKVDGLVIEGDSTKTLDTNTIKEVSGANSKEANSTDEWM